MNCNCRRYKNVECGVDLSDSWDKVEVVVLINSLIRAICIHMPSRSSLYIAAQQDSATFVARRRKTRMLRFQ